MPRPLAARVVLPLFLRNLLARHSEAAARYEVPALAADARRALEQLGDGGG